MALLLVASAIRLGAFVAAVHVRKHPLETSATITPAPVCENVEDRCCQTVPSVSTKENYERAPMIVWTHGCSGSSATLVMARDLAELGGRPVMNCGMGWELLADISKGYYGNSSKRQSLNAFITRANNHHRSLLFKGETQYARGDEDFMHDLRLHGSKVAVMKRSNALDVALCAVRDCFTSFTPYLFGWAVSTTGERSKKCFFRGRMSNQTLQEPQKVFIDTDVMLENLHQIMHNQQNTEWFLQSHGLDVAESESSEALFAFQEGTDGLQTSATAWIRFMGRLGVQVELPVVKEYLASLQGTHDRLQKHTEMILNIDQVIKTMDECEVAKDRMTEKTAFRTAAWCARVRSMVRGAAAAANAAAAEKEQKK